ncbi:hypothetical protein ES288_D01G146400v1, partial [Gossypium darwinii]
STFFSSFSSKKKKPFFSVLSKGQSHSYILSSFCTGFLSIFCDLKGFVFQHWLGYKEMAMAVIAARHAAKLHVEEIRSNKFAIGKKEPNPLTQDLHHAVSSLSAKFYTKGVHFFNGAYSECGRQ